MTTCAAIIDTTEDEHDLECGDPAVFECCGEPRCVQCAHDWLDDLKPGHEHTIRVIETEPVAAVDGRAN